MKGIVHCSGTDDCVTQSDIHNLVSKELGHKRGLVQPFEKK